MLSEGAIITEMIGIGEVKENDVVDEATTVWGTEVVAVLMLESNFACFVCNHGWRNTEQVEG